MAATAIPVKWALLLLLACGCSIVKTIKEPPYPYVLVHHTRAVGIETSIPNQAGDAVFKVRLGWFSDTISLIPTSTNKLEIPTISDTFRLGSGAGTITEDLVTGWAGQPPPARLKIDLLK